MTVRIDDALALVPLHDGFGPAIASCARTEHARLGRWFRWVHGGQDDDAARAFIGAVRERRANDLGDAYAIVVDGTFAGLIDIHSVQRSHDVGALGYWMCAAFERRGIMTRAVRAVTELAFYAHRLHRVEVIAAVPNTASRSVADRAGFRLEGILRERLWSPHGYDDAALYARLAGDDMPGPG